MATVIWIKSSPSLKRGLNILNNLDESKFEAFVNRIVTRFKEENTGIFTEEERSKLLVIFNVDEENLVLAIKTIVYLFKRMLKFVFMPSNLKCDLINIGISEDKADVFVKIWSLETSKTLNLGTDVSKILPNNDDMNINWEVVAELSSVIQKKTKVPKACVNISTNSTKTDLELTHPELHSLFLNIEAIQRELDVLI